MTIQQIRCFVTVASCGSINKAASLLYVSQPNLSTTIRSLETELGYQLLHRTRNGVELTAEGVIFLSHAREVLLQFDKLSLMEQLMDEPQSLSIATMAHCHVSEAMALLKQEVHPFPKRSQIRNGVRDEIVENVTNGNYRIGILYIYDIFKSQFVASLSAKRLSVQSLGTCHAEVMVGTASPYFDSPEKVIEPEQLTRHTYVTYTAKEYVPLVRVSRMTGLDQYDAAINVSDCSDLHTILNTLPSYTILPVPDKESDILVPGRLKIKDTYHSGEFVMIQKRDEVLSPIETRFLEILRGILE